MRELSPDERSLFWERTEFEVGVLDDLFGAFAEVDGEEIVGEYVDLRGPQQSVYVTSIVTLGGGERARAAVIEAVRPLVLGAAFKVLDFVVEQCYGVVHGAASNLGFEKKRKFATARGFRLPAPFPVDLGAHVGHLYDALIDARHSIVHRRLRVDPTGRVVPEGREGDERAGIGPDEIEAISILAAAIARVVATGEALGRRPANALASLLNRLERLHGLGSLESADAARASRPILAALSRDGDQLLPDVGRVAEYVRTNLQHGQAFARVTFGSQDGISVTCFLGDVPPTCSPFPRANPPEWVHEITGPAA